MEGGDRMIPLRCIISGGQTGADRGGLLAAHDLGLRRGGMAPAGWRAEDGVIPEWYREGMMQSASAAYPVRTRSNVEASGGTLITFLDELHTETGGTAQTRDLCYRMQKPCILLWAARVNLDDVARIIAWLRHFRIVTLNVAGPRESREPGIQAATRAALNALLGDELGFGGR